MRENLDVIKRLLAIGLSVFLAGSTLFGDFIVIADQENHCEEFTDDYAYTDNGTLVPGENSDGYCDDCGRGEEFHDHIAVPQEEAPEVVAENAPDVTEDVATDIGTGEGLEPTTDEQIPENPEQPGENPENITAETGDVVENPAETQTPQETTPEETAEITDETITTPETETPVENIEGTETEEETQKADTPQEEVTELDEIDEADKEAEEKRLAEEKEKEKKEGCIHNWEYTSNGDGTHVKRCTECGEEVAEECAFDGNGKCFFCGYEKAPEECEHEWEYTANNDGTHLRKCVKCGIEELENCEYGEDGLCKYCGAPNMTLEQQTYSRQFGTTTVTVSGNMPAHSKVTIYKAGTKVSEHIVNEKLDDKTFIAYEAYNINIYDASGRKYQPEEHGDSVTVSFSGVDELEKASEEEVTVYRIEDDYEITEIEAEVEGEDVTIEAEHFTTYTVGTINHGTYETFYKGLAEKIGYVETNSYNSNEPYLKVNSANFGLYADRVGTYKFTATAYKDLTSDTEPDSGTAVATADKTIDVTATGWQDIEITLNPISDEDPYVTYGKTYSVVLTLVDTPDDHYCIGYGTNSNRSYVKSTEWRVMDKLGILSAKVETSATAGDDYTITSISGPDPSSAVGSTVKLNPYGNDGTNDSYLYSKGDTGTFTATLSSQKADRNIVWVSGNDKIIEVNPSTGEFTAIAAGATTVEAQYTNQSGTTKKVINVKVIRFKIGDNDPNEQITETPYTGSAVQPEVKVYETSDDSAEVTDGVTKAFNNNTNKNVAYTGDEVAAKAEALISYKIGGKTFTFRRYFKITPLTLNPAAFTNETNLEEANGVITKITNIDPNNVYDAATKPKFDTDFTATIRSINTDANGKKYIIDLTGKGNFKDTATWEKTTTADSGITVRLKENAKPYYYTGSPIELAVDEDGLWDDFVFRDSEGNTIKFINPQTTDYIIAEKGSTTESINAGEKRVIFTVKNSYKQGDQTITPGLAGQSFIVDSFWILPADISKATVKWKDGVTDYTIPHDNDEHRLVPGDDGDFNLEFNGIKVDPTEYTAVCTGDLINVTGTSNIPTVTITGAGANFDARTHKTAQYKIVPNYDHDLVISIVTGSRTYDGTEGNKYEIPYNKSYNLSTAVPNNIQVSMNGTPYTKDVDYNIAVTEEDGTDLKLDVGTKLITVTPKDGGAFHGMKPKTATYKVVPRSLTIDNVDITKISKDKYTYTGAAINLKPAVPSPTNQTEAVTDDYDVKVSIGNNILTEGKDYELTCENNINAGNDAKFSIKGKENFTGTLTSANYKYTINPAPLSLDDVVTKAYVSLDSSSFVYDGRPCEPVVTVKIQTDGKPPIPVNPTDSSKTNYTVKYDTDTVSVGTKSVTVTGSNNLKGQVVLNYTVTSDTKAFKRITIQNDYTANVIAGEIYDNPTPVNGIVTRYYTCNVPISYTGSAFDGSVGVYDYNGKALVYNKDYRYAYVRTIDAKDYDLKDTYTKEASPRLIIEGQGSYKNNNAVVYLNVKPADISSDPKFTVTPTDSDGTIRRDWTGNSIDLSDLRFLLDTKELVKGTVDSDSGDCYVQYFDDKPDETGSNALTGDNKPSSAGQHYIRVTGRGNYKGHRDIPYTIGKDIGEAYVQILGAYSDNDVFLEKSADSNLATLSKNYTKDSPLANTVFWRGNDAAPRVNLLYLKPDGTDEPLTSETDYTLTMTNTDARFNINGNTGYRSRLTDSDTDNTYNIIRVDIEGGNKDYYGNATFYYRINPQDIRVLYKENPKNIGIVVPEYSGVLPYTGEKQNIEPELKFRIEGSSGGDYSLNNDTVKDFTPTDFDIGPAVSASVSLQIHGVGNFTGILNYKTEITKGNINIFKAQYKDDGNYDPSTVKFVDKTTGTKASQTYALGEDGDGIDLGTFTYNGKPQKPAIILTSRPSGDNADKPGAIKLVPPTDYTIQIFDDNKRGTAEEKDITCVGKKTIEIEVKDNENFYSGTIKLHYAIVTNSITDYVGSISDITYEAVDLTPAKIAEYIVNKKTTISLKKNDDSESKLVYGTDYVIVAPTNDTDKATELAGIQAQPEYSGVEDIRGDNKNPSYGTEKNWIFVKGIGTYSGYKQIFFNTVLDLGNKEVVQVYVTESHYTLDDKGETTVVPTIKYLKVKENDSDPDVYETFIAPEKPNLSELKDNYTISRDRDKLPGPDPSLAVNGQYACTGKASNVRCVDEDGNTPSVVYFLADLSDYGDKITFANGTVYRYTGDAVKPRPVGDVLDGATLAETDQDTGDYTIFYTRTPSRLDRSDSAIDVGEWYAVIKATADASNQYYVSNSSTAIPFYIKYNLADAEITVVDPAQGFKSVDSVEYTGNPFKLYTKKPYDQDESKRGNVRITIKGKEVYNEGSPGLPTNDYFTISPDSVTTVGEHTITVDKTTLGANFVYGDPNTSKKFRVTQVGLKTKAKFKLYDPDNPSTELYEYGYIGSAIKPVVKGTIDGKELVEGTDFRVTYNDNVNAGVKTASVSIKGLGAYSDSGTFTPEDCKFTITPLDLGDKDHVVVEVEDATYSGFYHNPKVPAEEDRVRLTPKYSVYYVDSAKKIKNLLKENTDGSTTSTAGDWKFYSWANNTEACDKNDSSIADDKKPRVKIESCGNNTKDGTYAVGYFTIHKLELARDNISIDETTHEFTGDWIDISDIVMLSTTYTNSSGKKVSVPLVRDGYSDDIGSDISDYTVTITGGSNIKDGKVRDRGNYRILISGKNSCESSFEVDFTVTPRSLEDHYHYYYEKGATTGWNGTWEYDKANKRYICTGKANGAAEDLTIYVYDVETVNTAGVTPEVIIEDKGRADSSLYTLDAAEFTVTPYNNIAAASAEWSKSTTTDANKGLHAKVADGSPYITITGTGDYGGTITLPFNIGRNINTEDLDIKYTVRGKPNPFTYKPEYDNPSPYQAEMQYTYNATRQYPSVSVRIKGGDPLRPDKDYKVTYTDAAGDEDSSINAGWKNVVITGIGDYCGKISQMYVINRKAITAKGGPYRSDSPMIASNDEQTQTLEFTLDGNTVTRFTDATLKTYLVDTGIMSAAQAAQFRGFHFAVYNRKDIKPKVNVIDYNLGSNGTTHLKISEDDLDFDYENENVASVFTKAEDGTVSLTTFSKVTVSFKRNYFVSQPTSTEATGSPGYVFHYIILQRDIKQKDFFVQFKDMDGANQYYDAGKNKEPDVMVTDGGQPLVEGTDYKKSYSKNHNVPGKHTVTVEGIGNFRGTETLDYTIWATMDDAKVGYYDEYGIFQEGIRTQQYTGEHITQGLPEIKLILPKNNDQLEDFKVEYGEHYTATNWGSDDGYLSVGMVEYSGLKTGYFMDKPTKKINYEIWFDKENIKAINYEPTYQFTGYDIIPDFKLNVSTGSIDKDSIKIYKNDDRTKVADNVSDVGKYTASMHYTIGREEGDIEANYEIVPRNIANCTIIPEENRILRYRGIAQKPGVKVFIKSTDIQTNLPNEPYLLDMFDGTSGDYQVEYDEAVYGSTDIKFTGESDRLSGRLTGEKIVNYEIKLQSVANLRVTDDTGDSLTVAWVGELYSDGTDLKLSMKKADGTYETKMLKRMVGRQNNTFTFEGLKNSTEYKIEAIAYATLKDGTEITSDPEEITQTTDIATTALKVTSRNAGRATISGWPNDGTVNHYYIYRSETPNDKGKVIAIIPATTRSYTNTKLDSGKTYYYTVEGYMFEGDGDKSVQVNTSKKIPVVVK